MTEKEAIHCMKSYLPEATVEDCRNCPFYGSMKTYDSQIFLCKSSEAHKMAIDALEKQVPKKPKKIDHWRLCPTCYEKYGFSYDYLVGMKQRGHENISYCLGCGQAIDWEEEG